ncbi:MAG: hypothetical protein V1875_05010 [Candidatus Altiarchaeota archaeon]
MKILLATLLLTYALLGIVYAETFPTDPFNGLQVSYTVSGATLQAPVDAYSFTCSRRHNGTLTGSKLTVAGSVKANNGYSGSVSVSVSAGDNQKTFSAEGNAPWSKDFSVSVDIPPGATSGGFTINEVGNYNAGTRGVVVSGTFGGKEQPLDTKGIGPKKKPPKDAGTFEPYNASKNYCGPEGKFSGPNKHLVSQASFNFACYRHDKCYAECGQTFTPQKTCDDEFKSLMDDACNEELDRIQTINEQRAWYNPVGYVVGGWNRVSTTSCWAQARLYWGIVAGGGKIIGAYECDDSKFA